MWRVNAYPWQIVDGGVTTEQMDFLRSVIRSIVPHHPHDGDTSWNQYQWARHASKWAQIPDNLTAWNALVLRIRALRFPIIFTNCVRLVFDKDLKAAVWNPADQYSPDDAPLFVPVDPTTDKGAAIAFVRTALMLYPPAFQTTEQYGALYVRMLDREAYFSLDYSMFVMFSGTRLFNDASGCPTSVDFKPSRTLIPILFG